MSNVNINAEQAINNLLDQIAFIQREKASIQMQLNAALAALEEKEGENKTNDNTV